MASETKREFSVAFYGLPVIHRIRELKTDKIGQLISLSGTVTRTTEVRPELVYATFTCNLCQKVYRDVEQQFKYTEVITCGRKLIVVKMTGSNTSFENSQQLVIQRLVVTGLSGHLMLNSLNSGIGKRSESRRTLVKSPLEVCQEREDSPVFSFIVWVPVLTCCI